MRGASTPAASIRFLISGTACAASGTLTVTRTISDPACASSMHCRAVVPTSAVSVLAIDWTTTGAPPPTVTGPTGTPTVDRRFLAFIELFNLPDGSTFDLQSSIFNLQSSMAGLLAGLPQPRQEVVVLIGLFSQPNTESGRPRGIVG